MKLNSFDMVLESLIRECSLEDLEATFLNLKIKTVYVLREVFKKEDLKAPFEIYNSSKISFKRGFLLKDFSLLNFYKEKDLFLVESGSLKNNSLLSTNKKINFLKDPFSEKLGFDEQNARSCFQNNIKVVFDVNKLRSKNKTQYLKQFSFILPLLKTHQVDVLFVSFAKNKEDLVSFNPIFFSFLKNYGLEETLICRYLSTEILDFSEK